MSFELPPLPYAKDALEPHISGKLMGFHYDKHHQGYVDKLNKLVEGTPYAGKALEAVGKRPSWSPVVPERKSYGPKLQYLVPVNADVHAVPRGL